MAGGPVAHRGVGGGPVADRGVAGGPVADWGGDAGGAVGWAGVSAGPHAGSQFVLVDVFSGGLSASVEQARTVGGWREGLRVRLTQTEAHGGGFTGGVLVLCWGQFLTAILP